MNLALLSVVLAGIALIGTIWGYRYAVRQIHLMSAIQMMDWMEHVRGDRETGETVRQTVRDLSGASYKEWTAEQKRAADTVVRHFDMVGLLDSCRYLDRRMVDRFHAIPARQMWKILNESEGYIAAIRDERGTTGQPGATHLWEFEQLAERVKNVQDRHPGLNGKNRWPRYPRTKLWAFRWIPPRQPSPL